MSQPTSPTVVIEGQVPVPPKAMGVFEFTLEVADLAKAEQFYHELLGFPIADRWGGDRPALWLTLGRESFLGLWSVEAGGEKAIHHGRGGVHVHFAIRLPHGTIEQMQTRLEAHGFTVERRDFGPGDIAIYIDDPDGNVVELTERVTLWDGSPATDDAQGS